MDTIPGCLGWNPCSFWIFEVKEGGPWYNIIWWKLAIWTLTILTRWRIVRANVCRAPSARCVWTSFSFIQGLPRWVLGISWVSLSTSSVLSFFPPSSLGYGLLIKPCWDFPLYGNFHQFVERIYRFFRPPCLGHGFTDISILFCS